MPEITPDMEFDQITSILEGLTVIIESMDKQLKDIESRLAKLEENHVC